MKSIKQNNCPKVSVLMTTRNRPHLVRGAIDSILMQAFQNFELIIVDASDNRETGKIIQSYRHPKIRYVRKKCGIACGRNIGLRLSRAPYITYCDDDERYYRNRLGELVRFLEKNPDVGLVYTDMLAININNREKLFRMQYDFEKSHLESECFFGVGNVMHRKKCIDLVGYYDERFIVAEDWDFWLRISAHFKIARLAKVLHIYLIHGGNVTLNQRSDYGRAYECMIKKIIKEKSAGEEGLKNFVSQSALPILRNLLCLRKNSLAAYFIRTYCKNEASYQGVACFGLQELLKGRYHRGIHYFKKSLEIIANNEKRLVSNAWQKENIALVYFYLAQGYLRVGNIFAAIEAAQSAQSYSHRQFISLLLTRCYIETGCYPEALRQINDSPKESLYDFLNVKGCYYFAIRDFKNAVREFKKAVSFYPQFTIARHNLALAYQKLGRIDKSNAERREIFRLKSKDCFF